MELDEPCPNCDEIVTFTVGQRNIRCDCCGSALRHTITYGQHELLVTKRAQKVKEDE